MKVELLWIGKVRTDEKVIPRHWSCSDVEGTLVIDDRYADGLTGIKPGDRTIVIFQFHKSRDFTLHDLIQHPRGDFTREKRGVFDLCSPIRPNPIGMSVVKVISIVGNRVHVKGLDMVDGTPILDIKPFRHVTEEGHE